MITVIAEELEQAWAMVLIILPRLLLDPLGGLLFVVTLLVLTWIVASRNHLDWKRVRSNILQIIVSVIGWAMLVRYFVPELVDSSKAFTPVVITALLGVLYSIAIIAGRFIVRYAVSPLARIRQDTALSLMAVAKWVSDDTYTKEHEAFVLRIEDTMKTIDEVMANQAAKPATSKATKIVPLLTLLLLLTGCITVYVTATPSPGPSPTVESTIEATPTTGPTVTPSASLPGQAAPTATPSQQPTPTSVPGPVENILLCWGFECSWQYDYRHPTGGLKVPLGWTAFWQGNVPGEWETSPPSDRFCNDFIPAVEVEQHHTHVKERMFSGRVIQSARNCPAGLMQTVSVETGKAYIFSGYLFNWSTNNPQVDTPSTDYIHSWIGLDPMGGTDWRADSVVWSNEESAQDKFAYMEVEAVAQGDSVTVFLLSIPNFAVARSDSFWDNFSLIETVAPLPSIVETGPAPGWDFPDQLGTIVYDTISNLRECADSLWATPFDPQVSCPFDEDQPIETMDPGEKAGVVKWGHDRYGNLWARYLVLESLKSQTSVACYKGQPRGKFYPGVQVSQFDGLAVKGLLPPAQNPCLVK